MALGSQATTAELISELTGLTHDIFVGQVQKNVRRESAAAMLFQEAGAGQYHMEGQNMVFATDLNTIGGGMASSGNLPDHVGLDAVQGKITPIRRYRRIALDNLVELRASGPGAFENLGTRIVDLLWESWKNMEIRHAIGASSTLIGTVESRTSSTAFVIKDGYGNVGTNPTINLIEGMPIAWWDITATAAIDGAAKISTATPINHTTRAITVDSATTWEPGDILAAGDLIYACTTNNISTDYFEAERNLGPNGLGTIVDPSAGSTTVFNISETTNPRWKPFRKDSVTFDHLELTEHWLQLGQKRGFEVTPGSDVVITFPSARAQLARSLIGFQQQTQLGGTLTGGWTGLTVNGIPIKADGFFYHNVCMTLHTPSLYRVTLGGEADFKAEDGSQWSRIADFDGKEAYVGEYMNFFCTHRGANGALTGITTDVTDADFEPVPNY
jgi:hypothetical protein